MPLTPVVLDTDILSAVMRQQPVVAAKAGDYLRIHGQFTFSIITRYEILRGLKAKRATTQVVAFDRFCTANRILALSDAIIFQAAEIYADLYRRGELIGDADILIAASAIVHGFAVSTNNESHFGRIRGLRVENWLT
jgi:tRNA(fMet)-specific endonuclease VapC